MSTTEASPDGSKAAPLAEQRVEELLELNRAAIAITSELDLDSLLQRIVDSARLLGRCDYAALGVLGDDGYLVRFPTSGISQHEREQIGAPPRGHGLLGVMLRAGRTLCIPDMSKDPRRVGFPPHHPPMTSLLGVPIFVQGKLIGDLYLTDKIGGPEFSEEDEWLVQLLATHAATALTNAQLHAENVAALQQVRRERASFQALFRVTQAINRSVELQEVVSLIVNSAVELLEASAAGVYLLEQPGAEIGADSDSSRFVSRFAIGLEETLTTAPAQLPMDRSIAGRAVRSGQTQLVPDTAQEASLVYPKLAGGTLRSLVAVPLVASGLMWGVLSVYYDRPNAFDAEAVRLLEAFAAVASTAVYNATLYDEALKGRQAAEREQERLRELEQMKDEFLSTAAHELRTPLTTIRMSAGLAHEQLRLLSSRPEAAIDARLLDLTGLLVEGSQRMHSLVNDLLDLTRLEQGRASFNPTDVDLREVVTAASEAVRPLLDDKKQSLSVHLPEAAGMVRGDRGRLEQVIVNLLSNANKYTPSGAKIEVRLLRQGGECQVRVRDDGPGVPAEEREHIFDRFYRSSMHRNDRTPSTGLGLPIARKIAEMHGGALWVEPSPDGGSIFILNLPLLDHY